MHDILKEILIEKEREVTLLKEQMNDQFTLSEAKKQLGSKSFKASIRAASDKKELAFIGEIKRKSPSKGDLANIPDPHVLLEQYVKGGVSAVSVLTDEKFFSGSIADLKQVSTQLEDQNIAVLRKDFILDEIQIFESIISGANAILLIVALLEDKAIELLSTAKKLGIDAIVEVHNRTELDFAIEIGAEIIGINNRDLHTFSEDINVSLDLVQHIPSHIIKIAESAIKTLEEVRQVRAAGFDAVLIGEALVKAENPSLMLKEMRGVL